MAGQGTMQAGQGDYLPPWEQDVEPSEVAAPGEEDRGSLPSGVTPVRATSLCMAPVGY